MIDSLLMATAAGVAADRIGSMVEPETESVTVRLLAHIDALLQLIAKNTDAVSPVVNTTVVLNPYSWEYELPEYTHPHVSIFMSSQNNAGTTITSANLRFNVPGIGVLYKNVNVGWTQLDLPPHTLISTNDTYTYNTIFSYRDLPLGTSL